MNEKIYEKLKDSQAQCASQEFANALGKEARNGFGGASLGGPVRCSLRERVREQFHDAQNQSRCAERLAELEYLLDKNPEVARILDLLESVRV